MMMQFVYHFTKVDNLKLPLLQEKTVSPDRA